MADEPQLIVALRAELAKFEADLRKAGLIAEGELKNVENKLGLVGAAVSGLIGGAVGGAIGALSHRLLDLVNPTRLVADAIDLVGQQIVDSFAAGAPELRTLDAALKDHSETVKALREHYGDAGKALREFATESVEVLKTRQSAALIELQINLDKLATATVNATTRIVPSLSEIETGVAELSQVIETREQRFKPFLDALTALRASVQAGAPDIRAFRDAVAQIAAERGGDKNIQLLANELLRMTEEASKADRALRALRDGMSGLGAAAAEAAAQGARFATALEKIGAIAPTQLSDRARALQLYNEAISQTQGLEERRAAEAAYSDALKRISEQERQRATAVVETETAFDRAVITANKRIAVMNAEAAAIGKGVFEQARMRKEAELLDAAQRQGAIATDEQRKKIEELSIKYGEAAANATKANEAFRLASSITTTGVDKFTDALVDVASGAKNFEEAFREMTASVLKDIAKLIVKAQLLKLLEPLTGTLTGVLAGKQAGGPVLGGVAYRVGERGPEIFVPSTSGVIVPNAAISSGVGGQVINLSFGDNIVNAPAGMNKAELTAVLAIERRRMRAEVVPIIKTAASRGAL
jgi:hypothetical protein